MNELISLTQSAINGELQQTVNARELHAFLESKQDFSTWIKNRIEKYGFLENQDFAVSHKKMENPQGGRPAIEYYITLDMAKEVAMIENNEKGRDVRQYFIACEKQAKQASTASLSEQLKVAQIGLLNRVLDDFGDKISPQAREALLLAGSEKFLGISTGYRPPAHNLKTEEYGIWALDQSAHSNKQITSFRYYENVVPVLKALINTSTY